MKDEIKEILESLDKIAKAEYYPEDLLTYKECQLLLDYITNLQTIEREYSFLLSENAELENKITNLQEENERLKIQVSTKEKECMKLQEIINKATEYINNLRDESAERQGFYNCFPDDLYIADIEELLEILIRNTKRKE